MENAGRQIAFQQLQCSAQKAVHHQFGLFLLSCKNLIALLPSTMLKREQQQKKCHFYGL
jgi:hypothetical protein